VKRGFYTAIADYYESIFSLGNEEKNFYDSLGISRKDSVLDAGCGTGELARFIGEKVSIVLGIDNDENMIAHAREKSKSNDRVRFASGNLETISDVAGHTKFDYIFCMGNTLVHLLSEESVVGFFRNVKGMLAEHGKFVFQILNYKKLVSLSVKELPAIDNEILVFKRMYKIESRGKVVFRTSLFIKSTGEEFNQETVLRPLLHDDLPGICDAAGLRLLHAYGGFDKTGYSADESKLLICVLVSDPHLSRDYLP
jgi:glycine/sarcosine N-methyltransferase